MGKSQFECNCLSMFKINVDFKYKTNSLMVSHLVDSQQQLQQVNAHNDILLLFACDLANATFCFHFKLIFNLLFLSQFLSELSET